MPLQDLDLCFTGSIYPQLKKQFCTYYELCRTFVTHIAIKTPQGDPSSFLHPVKFLILIFVSLYSLKLAYISAIISYMLPWDASSTQNLPLLIAAGELISTPLWAKLNASFLISTLFFLSKSQVTSFNSLRKMHLYIKYYASPTGKWELTSPVHE